MAAWNRVLVWLATGPLGRLAAFVLDLGGALIGAARRRLKMNDSRPPTPGGRTRPWNRSSRV